ncbi:NF-X1-type zinc finger protein [Tetrabaena socialis]|uniref:NF-X1-type zinc finger protein n=1 Tax=Tetrabaena socialis TaxID=47790 RepID=A0A2J8AJH8_9CHLO|nr:NF-X1-type zinc finger protein [Tetrabaena socialis]|eukprot:PNH12668.1 NF-X1-type zinc finger protein [Tetrabaena socialis]
MRIFDVAKGYFVAITSLFAGASVVHYILKPDLVCHSGPCGECPSAGERTCPCGRVSHEGLSCADKVPTCGETCGRLLACGVHRCRDRCHHGECTVECRGPTLKTCRCGKSQKEVLCLQDFTCERRCGEVRACGRHPCRRRCCDGNCPPCEEVCGRRLKCGNHKCPAPCHSGPCRPCPLTGTVACACGRSACTLPCGAESRAEAPHCAAPCSVPRICRHGPRLPPHRCHYGPCPPCPGPCATPLSCGHSCATPTCHDPPPPPVPDFQQPPAPKAVSIAAAAAAAAAAAVAAAAAGGGDRERASRSGSAALPGPAVQQPTALAAQILAATAARGELPSACPPCVQPVQLACVGAHVRRPLPCAQARPYCCAAACGRPLQCGNHACGLPCHAVAYDAIATAVAAAAAAAAATSGYPDPLVPRPCRQCDRRCDRPRGCAHPCKLACHRGPCPRCEVQSRTACLCGRSTLQLACHQAVEAAGGDAAAAAAVLSCGKPCHRQLRFCSHPCKAICHAGPCPDPAACAAEVNVRCDCPAKRRAKWRCSEVQAALEQAGKPRAYDDSQAPRLLPCDADCAKARAKGAAAAAPPPPAASKAAAASTAADAAAESSRAGQGGSGAQVVAVEAAAGGKGGKARLSRAEREAAAAAKEAERLRQERLSRVVRGVLLAVVVALGVLLALGARQAMAWLDARMYAPVTIPMRKAPPH